MIIGAEAHAHHVEKARAVLPVSIKGKLRGGWKAHPSAADAREYKAWKFESQLCAQFIRVEQRVVPVGTSPRLPLIRAKNLERHLFAPSEGIALGQFVRYARAHLLVALQRGIHFECRVIQFVHHRRHHEVERVAGGSSVAWHITHVHLAQHPELSKFLNRHLLVAQAVHLSLAVCNGMAPHVGAQWHLFASKVVSVAASHKLCVERFTVVVANADICAPHIPWVVRLGRSVVYGHNLQLHKVFALYCVSAERCVVSIKVIVAIVAQQRFNARLLPRQVHHAKGIARFQQFVLLVQSDEAVHGGRVVQVRYRVKTVKLSGPHIICHLRLFRVLQRQNVIVYLAMKVAIVVQRVGSHLGTHLRAYLAHKHRFGAKSLVYPFAQSALGVIQPVVHPESDFPGPAHGR